MRPNREPATNNRQTYFVGSQTMGRKRLFQVERWAELFIETLIHYRDERAFQLHGFVLMPDHFHAIITPHDSLEKAMQYIKGGFSHRAKKQFDYRFDIWQPGFSDHRIRDAADFEKHTHYIWMNPVKRHLCERAQDYPYGSAFGRWKLDPIPQRLKPLAPGNLNGGPEGPPLQSDGDLTEDPPLRNIVDPAKAATCQGVGDYTAAGELLQRKHASRVDREILLPRCK